MHHEATLKERAAATYEEVMQRQKGAVRRRGQGETADKLDPIQEGDRVHVFSAREAGRQATAALGRAVPSVARHPALFVRDYSLRRLGLERRPGYHRDT